MTARVTGAFPTHYCEKSSTFSRAETPQRGFIEVRQREINARQSLFHRCLRTQSVIRIICLSGKDRADKYLTMNRHVLRLTSVNWRPIEAGLSLLAIGHA